MSFQGKQIPPEVEEIVVRLKNHYDCYHQPNLDPPTILFRPTFELHFTLKSIKL